VNGVTFRVIAWEKLCGGGGADWCRRQACGLLGSNVDWLKGGGGHNSLKEDMKVQF
jgi:hypothetical protein